MASSDTYTGPDPAAEKKFFGGSSAPMSGGMFIAIGLAVVGVGLSIFAIVSAGSADDHAGHVEKSVTKLGEAHDALVKKVKEDHEWVVVQLATKAAAVDVEAAIVLLTAKADQSVVDKLSTELKASGKATDSRVTRLASDLLLKADAKAVNRIARKVSKANTRLDNLVNLNKLIEVAPVVAPPPPPPPAAAPPPAKAPPAAPK